MGFRYWQGNRFGFGSPTELCSQHSGQIVSWRGSCGELSTAEQTKGLLSCTFLGSTAYFLHLCLIKARRLLLLGQVNEIRSQGGVAERGICDVTDDASQRAVFQAHVDQWHSLDVVFLNAGIAEQGRVVCLCKHDLLVSHPSLLRSLQSLPCSTSLAGSSHITSRMLCMLLVSCLTWRTQSGIRF